MLVSLALCHTVCVFLWTQREIFDKFNILISVYKVCRMRHRHYYICGAYTWSYQSGVAGGSQKQKTDYFRSLVFILFYVDL